MLFIGDVNVGVIGVGPKGTRLRLQKLRQIKDINLGSGRFIRLQNRYICDENLSDELVADTIRSVGRGRRTSSA